jgi:glycosyltransferase involved in cell wall biosynthesis
MVATLEPRKGQPQVFQAMEKLWSRGHDVNLVFVGSKGWKMEALEEKILSHLQINKRLFWLESISDEYLEKVYKASTCLIAASLNEGFGLPLIEAAKYGLPIIVRDIPVFREVAGDYAYYFSGTEPEVLEEAISKWLSLHADGRHPKSDTMPWSTWRESAENLKKVLFNNYRDKQLFVDVSELVQRDAATGIQRVVRNLLFELLDKPPKGYRVEPVYATTSSQQYFHARQFTSRFMGLNSSQLIDDPVDFGPKDIFLALDLCPGVQCSFANYYKHLQENGVSVYFFVYDLLPALRPDWWKDCETGKLMISQFQNWIRVVASSTGAICISQATANDLRSWVNRNKLAKKRMPIKTFVSCLGADFKNANFSFGLPTDTSYVLKRLSNKPTFLTVGTLEPRKGHKQIVDAFEFLWEKGDDINLVIVGKQGWMVEKLVKRLKHHPELNKRLFWFSGISDEYLEKIYTTSSCLIAASEGEGFGLPLIEAAQHKLPIVARDIPVFREVAGGHAYYFKGKEPVDLSRAIQEWLRLYEQDKHPKSDDMPWLTWEQSAMQLKKILFQEGKP